MFDCGLHYRDPAQAETGSFDRHRSWPLEPSSPLRDPEVRVISYFVAPQRGRPDPGRGWSVSEVAIKPAIPVERLLRREDFGPENVRGRASC
jgi:hypothetical protein